jgi:hypothetical protein
MAFTFSNIRKRSLGDRKATVADVTVSTTGVGTFSPLSVGLHRVERISAEAADTVSTNIIAELVTTTAGATHTLAIYAFNAAATTTEAHDNHLGLVTDGEYRIEFIGW